MIRIKAYYPHDKNQLQNLPAIASSAVNNLVSLNRLDTPLQTEAYEDTNHDGIIQDNELLSSQRTNFTNRFLFYYPNESVVAALPDKLQTMKGMYVPNDNEFSDHFVFNNYYDNGNIKEISRKDGLRTVYIWGYNEKYPIAILENSNYAEVVSQVVYLQNFSDQDDDHCAGIHSKEQQLRVELQSLRNGLPNAMVTTYTYDLLIGMTSMTDPRGIYCLL